MQTIPFSVLSTSSLEAIVVSRSEAETVSDFPSRLNRKLSKIGRVLLLLIIPPKTCSCFNKYELDTMNFIEYLFFDQNDKCLVFSIPTNIFQLKYLLKQTYQHLAGVFSFAVQRENDSEKCK